MLPSVLEKMNGIGRTFGCLTACNPNFSKLRFFSTLFVSRLSFYTTNDELMGMFSPFGPVKEARLVFDPRTQRPKGFGFVTFETEVEAAKAMKSLNGTIVRGRLIFVEPMKAKEDAGDSQSQTGLQPASRSAKP